VALICVEPALSGLKRTNEWLVTAGWFWTLPLQRGSHRLLTALFHMDTKSRTEDPPCQPQGSDQDTFLAQTGHLVHEMTIKVTETCTCIRQG
jgi:hypothetical protein